MNYIDFKNAARLNTPTVFSSQTEIFNHHFPDKPLLPGALSALLLSEACGGQDWFLSQIQGLRFRKPLTPDLPISISCDVKRETASEKVCVGKITSAGEPVADGEFTFTTNKIPNTSGSSPATDKTLRNAQQIREYLPHGEPIVLIDQLVQVDYPQEVQELITNNNAALLEQSQLTGSRVHTKSTILAGNFWLDQNVLPSPILSELAAQAGALTLAPFFKGTKPQVSLLGCDTKYYATATAGSAIDTYVDLKRVKRLGQTSNMILFHCECYVSDLKIAEVNLNAMASF